MPTSGAHRGPPKRATGRSATPRSREYAPSQRGAIGAATFRGLVGRPTGQRVTFFRSAYALSFKVRDSRLQGQLIEKPFILPDERPSIPPFVWTARELSGDMSREPEKRSETWIVHQISIAGVSSLARGGGVEPPGHMATRQEVSSRPTTFSVPRIVGFAFSQNLLRGPQSSVVVAGRMTSASQCVHQ
jgi:hypothetical protein